MNDLVQRFAIVYKRRDSELSQPVHELLSHAGFGGQYEIRSQGYYPFQIWIQVCPDVLDLQRLRRLVASRSPTDECMSRPKVEHNLSETRSKGNNSLGKSRDAYLAGQIVLHTDLGSRLCFGRRHKQDPRNSHKSTDAPQQPSEVFRGPP